MTAIDLNCDMGELPSLLEDGTQESLLQLVSSVNVSCGAHAGNPALLDATLQAAHRHGVAVGAHPSYPDRENFGRLPMSISLAALADSIAEQLISFSEAAESCGVTVAHVKPHGALYNVAAQDEKVAQAIVEGVSRWRRDVALFGLAGSRMLAVFTEAGFPVVAEAFADRRYEPDGSLRSRQLPGAVLPDPQAAAQQALNIAQHHTVIASDNTSLPLRADTLCLHSDTPHAVAMAKAVVDGLHAAGIIIRPPHFA